MCLLFQRAFGNGVEIAPEGVVLGIALIVMVLLKIMIVLIYFHLIIIWLLFCIYSVLNQILQRGV